VAARDGLYSSPNLTPQRQRHLQIIALLRQILSLASLTTRLDRLGASKEIAQIGAAIGREFSYRLFAAVAASCGPLLQTALAHITASELIFARGEPPNSIYFD
jgi:predicted ATPase